VDQVRAPAIFKLLAIAPVQKAFPEASVERYLPADAPVGRRKPLRLPVPFTSSVYHGVVVAIPSRVQVWKTIEE
jgi:hypothetical protein